MADDNFISDLFEGVLSAAAFSASGPAFMPTGEARSAPPPKTVAQISQADATTLQSQVDRLNLMMQTMLKLMIEKGITSKEEFRQWMDYMDQLDGSADGRLRRAAGAQACPSCRRNNPVHAVSCQYCGAKFETKIFDHEPPPGSGG